MYIIIYRRIAIHISTMNIIIICSYTVFIIICIYILHPSTGQNLLQLSIATGSV